MNQKSEQVNSGFLGKNINLRLNIERSLLCQNANAHNSVNTVKFLTINNNKRRLLFMTITILSKLSNA